MTQTDCFEPFWANDNYCDDYNNTPECNFDGGACCNNDKAGWDDYCTACECIDPSVIPTPVCGSPLGANNMWCDDENNNAGCNWDGGACCNNNEAGWDDYCSACECLDPNAVTTTTTPPTTTPPCEDIWTLKKCTKRKNAGKCDGTIWMDVVRKHCQKTCQICGDNATPPTTTAAPTTPDPNLPCEDIWTEKKCLKRKNKGKCDGTIWMEVVRKHCQKTCEVCTD